MHCLLISMAFQFNFFLATFENCVQLIDCVDLIFQDNVFIHLTNYSINKSSEDFVRDEENGSKR